MDKAKAGRVDAVTQAAGLLRPVRKDMAQMTVAMCWQSLPIRRGARTCRGVCPILPLNSGLLHSHDLRLRMAETFRREVGRCRRRESLGRHLGVNICAGDGNAARNVRFEQ